MTHLRQFRAAYRRTTVWFAALMLVFAALGAGLSFAQGVGQKDFDHLRTGFSLTGNHVQTRCESCHQNGIFKGTPRDCASCHQPGMRFSRGNLVMPLQHLPTQLACESCHNTKTFVGARFNHGGVAAGSCQSCHNGTITSGKTSNHIQTTATCDTCHRSAAWSPAARFDHVGVAPGTCTSCHGAGRATAKPAQHMPTNAGQSCDDCHKRFTAWRPTAWNHTQMAVTAQCATCHSGAYPPADGRPNNHVPYQSVAAAAAANCDSCHRGNFTTWANGRLHANISISTGCVSCHTLTAGGSFLNAVGKPATATHTGVTGNCESCHRSTTSWAAATFAHTAATAVGTGTCDTCHGVSATGKPATHIPVTSAIARCDACHRSQARFATALTMNHTSVATAQCKTCHNGGFVSQGPQGALAKPPNHIPEAQLLNGAAIDCNACHRSTTSWGTVTMNHNASVGNGAGWCKSCHDSITRYLGSMERRALLHRATAGQVITDCSQSGCHRPLGTRGTPYTSW